MFFQRTCASVNFLQCGYLFGIILSDYHYQQTFPYHYIVWRNHFLCYVLGLVFILSKQVYFFSCLGQIAFKYYIVSSTWVLRAGEKSTTVMCYLIFSGLAYVLLAVSAHVFVNPSSDFCLSLAFSFETDILAKVSIVFVFTVNSLLVITMITIAIKITQVVTKVEKGIKKKRKKTRIIMVFFIILVNFVSGIVPEGIAIGVMYRTVFVEDWIYIFLSVLQVILHPIVMK